MIHDETYGVVDDLIIARRPPALDLHRHHLDVEPVVEDCPYSVMFQLESMMHTTVEKSEI